MKSLNTIRNEVHLLAKEKGWHSIPETDDAYIARSCANFHGEISELWEAHRANKLTCSCDKHIALSCEEEEIADLIIRVLDYCGRRNIDAEKVVETKHQYNKSRSIRHGNKKA